MKTIFHRESCICYVKLNYCFCKCLDFFDSASLFVYIVSILFSACTRYFSTKFRNCALRASLAVTRLTVHRRSQVIRGRFQLVGDLQWERLLLFWDRKMKFWTMLDNSFSISITFLRVQCCQEAYTLEQKFSRRNEKLKRHATLTPWKITNIESFWKCKNWPDHKFKLLGVKWYRFLVLKKSYGWKKNFEI